MAREQFWGPKWSYFVNFRCTGRSGPLSGPGPWGFSLTSLMDDPALITWKRCKIACKLVLITNRKLDPALMPWSGNGSWVTGDAGHGSADWWVTWVTGYKMWPIVSSAIDGNIPKRYYQITNRKYNSNTWNNRCFFETRSSNISATDWAISLKFGQQNGFRPFQISDVTKSGAGPGSRFETPGGPSSKVDVTLFYVPEWTVVVVAAYRRGLQKRRSLGGHRILQHRWVYML